MIDKNDILIDSFLQNNIGIDSQFLSQQLSLGLQQNIKQLNNENKMLFASVGNDLIKESKQNFRGDKIYWLDKKHDNTFEQEFLIQIESFIKRLNTTCYTGINSYEFHYALYEPGTGYKKHKDQFKNDSGRKFSVITYLNSDWEKGNGGELLIYNNDIIQQIEPISQKAVFFNSSEIEHEVAISFKPRMSITGWLKIV